MKASGFVADAIQPQQSIAAVAPACGNVSVVAFSRFLRKDGKSGVFAPIRKKTVRNPGTSG